MTLDFMRRMRRNAIGYQTPFNKETAMVTVGMNYEILPGKEQEFEKVFAKVGQIMGTLPGHVESHLYKNVSAPRSYLIMSEWSDRTSFDAFIASEQFKNVANWGKEQILASRPKHEIYGADTPKPMAGKCPVGAH
jgi:heme-degrading monooxygenase HmoA